LPASTPLPSRTGEAASKKENTYVHSDSAVNKPTHSACAPSIRGQIFGMGTSFLRRSTSSATACCSLCVSHAACAAWTYHDQGPKINSCYLQASIFPVRTDSTALSASAQGRFDGWNACTGDSSVLPFCDTALSMHERLSDLVGRISTADAAAQLTARQSPALPSIGVPAYYWGTNAIHGLQNVRCLPDGRCPTSFPAPCALAASFNMENVRKMASIIGSEMRSYFHAGEHNSLDTWSPTININRDPRWGRNVESPSEDPFLSGSFGVAYTTGLQSERSGNGREGSGKGSVRQATVTLKHWVAYSVENYGNVTRHTFNAKVSAYDLASSYMRPFEMAIVEGGAAGVMCSYNLLNGKPTCGNPDLTSILRDEWGFNGYITSDTDACEDIYKTHEYEKTPELAVRDCLLGGTDIDSGSTYARHLAAAVSQGAIGRTAVQQALYRTYKSRFESGLFDPPGSSPFLNASTASVGCEAHQAASLHAARQAIVLLRNDNKTLPFTPTKRLALIGRAVNDSSAYTGNYNGPLCADGTVRCWPSLCQYARAYLKTEVACHDDVDDLEGAVKAAKAAEQVVLVVDNALDGGGEGHDRLRIGLEAGQKVLAHAVLGVGVPCALVMINGGIIAIDELKDEAPAVVEAFMPGVHGAQAMTESLFGAVNPGGKLPVTIYHSSYIDSVDFLDMSMQAGPGRSYRFFDGEPLYPFGFGLSYTTFELDWTPAAPSTESGQSSRKESSTGSMADRSTGTPKTSITASAPQSRSTSLQSGAESAPRSRTSSSAPSAVFRSVGDTHDFYVNVTNTGGVFGDEVVMAFVAPVAASFRTHHQTTPIERKRLFGFKRIGLAPGASATVAFTLRGHDLALTDAEGQRALHSGAVHVIFSRGHGQQLRARVAVDVGAAPVVQRKLPRWW